MYLSEPFNKNVELTKIHYYTPKNQKNSNVNVNTVTSAGGSPPETPPSGGVPQNVIIKRNIFGHRWVLQINEEASVNSDDLIFKKPNLRVVSYFCVFLCILMAVLFGIFFALSLEKKFFGVCNDKKFKPKIDSNDTLIKFSSNNTLSNNYSAAIFEKVIEHRTSETIINNIKLINDASIENQRETMLYCKNCTKNEICFKDSEFLIPKCTKIKSRHDPSGCGGLCQRNVQYCQILEKTPTTFQCSFVSSNMKKMLHCTEEMFDCGNKCISIDKKCDGVINCSNFADEHDCAECNLETHFQCTNSTLCLENHKKCDGILDCLDRSDEENCFSEYDYGDCRECKFLCSNGECIDKHLFCDGKSDCTDNSDEPKGC